MAGYVAEHFDRLAGQTRLWNQTWYDSTLPYWFLDRTLTPVNCLATQAFHAFDNGRFWGWEGVDCCPGTCQHVWQYAQSVARLFPAIERDLRERVDFGLAWHDNGAMDFRAENDRHVAHDGFCGTILRAYREHQMAPDSAFLTRIWPRIKKSVEFIMGQDRDGDGLLEGEQMNTLDTAWFGPMAWISSLYLAALAAGAAMADEMGDAAFAARCRKRRRGRAEEPGDEALQRRVLHPQAARLHAQQHQHRLPFRPDARPEHGLPGGSAAGRPRGRGAVGAASRSGGTTSRPTSAPTARSSRRSPAAAGTPCPARGDCWSRPSPTAGPTRPRARTRRSRSTSTNAGPASSTRSPRRCSGKGMITEGLAIVRMIHDRYHPARRNPYNEVECSDHYARAMASHGVFLAACGFEYHGPKGHLGFAPRVAPSNFRAPFTAAEGWGTFSQTRQEKSQHERIEVKWGKLRLKTLAFEVPEGRRVERIELSAAGQPVQATFDQAGTRVTVTLSPGNPSR